MFFIRDCIANLSCRLTHLPGVLFRQCLTLYLCLMNTGMGPALSSSLLLLSAFGNHVTANGSPQTLSTPNAQEHVKDFLPVRSTSGVNLRSTLCGANCNNSSCLCFLTTVQGPVPQMQTSVLGPSGLCQTPTSTASPRLQSQSTTCWSSISFCCLLICFPLCICLGFYREKGILSHQLSHPSPWPTDTHESAHECISTRKKLLDP